ncbi:MAG TPA: D-arabinono-1,4-lactone oxidase [Stellaceae bacterium]|nr:D-arabinono-1,4-lactone oxidase [Stellaceae bacterium]
MAREHNWADNHSFKAARIHRPISVDELRRLVASSPRIHAVGTRHSFNGCADSAGDLVDLGRLGLPSVIDPDRGTVTLASGTSYAVLASHLASQGWALHNTASLPHISVAGAIATGTHGSGDRNGGLATAVAAIELVTASGALVEVRRGSADFDGLVVGLGASGIVTRVTLDLEPNFALRQDAFAGLSWATLLLRLDEVMACGYSVSVMTRWCGDSVDRLWVKTRLGPDRRPDTLAAEFGMVPARHASWRDISEAAAGLNLFGSAGPWSERLPHFRPDAVLDPRQVQSEYMVPREHGAAALARLHAIGDRIDRHLVITELRTVAPDGLWLSPCYGQDSLAIHFTWKREPEAVHELTVEIEELLLPLGARPHWGKFIHARADRLAGLYPRMGDFRTLARRYDPDGKFRNDFLDTHVFG